MADTPLRPRHDGWTPDRQATFLAALTAGGSVAAAAAAAGMSRQAAYRLRARSAAVAAAWGAPPVTREAQCDRFAEIIAGFGARLGERIDANAAADPRGHGRWLMREIAAHRKRRFASTSVTFQRRAALAAARADHANGRTARNAMLALDPAPPAAPPYAPADTAPRPPAVGRAVSRGTA